MRSKDFVIFAFLAVSVLGSDGTALHAAGSHRPNVLLLIADDLNVFLGCYGDPRARTPNLDRLAAKGVRFQRAYCNYPLCGPSRNSMLTGLYPNSTGIYGNRELFRQTIPSQVSLPQAFRQSGYLAARVGKIYHYDVPNAIGTDGHDDPASWEIKVNPAGVDHLEEERKMNRLVPEMPGGLISWYASPAPDEDHTDGMVASHAIALLQTHAAAPSRPFFLAVGFFRPHGPYIAPKNPYFEQYRNSEMPLPTNVSADQADIPAAALSSYNKGYDKFTDDLRRDAMQAYYASISFVDAQVGRIVGALERLELSENTVIVFTSDHGYHLGEHGMWRKNTLFENSARVPLIVVAPGAPQQRTAISPVGLVDLYPTLAELCGVESPDNLQGQSLVPMLRNPNEAGRGWAVTQVRRGSGKFGYSLRTARWRYTEWDAGEHGVELYDHDRDPGELTNLARDPAMTTILGELSSTLRKAIGATFPEDGKIPQLSDAAWSPEYPAK